MRTSLTLWPSAIISLLWERGAPNICMQYQYETIYALALRWWHDLHCMFIILDKKPCGVLCYGIIGQILCFFL